MIEVCVLEDMRLFAETLKYYPRNDFRAIKQVTEGDLVIMVGYDHWTPNSFYMHVWAPLNGHKISRTFIREALRYPFVQCNRGLAIGVTPGDNAPALEFNRRIGFEVVYRVKDAWSVGTDVVIQELRRENCRWI